MNGNNDAGVDDDMKLEQESGLKWWEVAASERVVFTGGISLQLYDTSGRTILTLVIYRYNYLHYCPNWVILCALIHDTACVADCIASSDEFSVGKDRVGSRGLFEVLTLYFTGHTGKITKTLSQDGRSQQRFPIPIC